MGISYRATLMLAAVLLCLSVSASKPKFQEKPHDFGHIVGGHPTTIENVPWQASITTSGSHDCGGVIVSELIIVTAAHCLNLDIQDYDYQVRTGSTTVDQGGVLTDVIRIVQHELYTKYVSNDYDIGFVVLSEPLQFGPGTLPISLARQDDPLVEGELVQVTGWGELTEEGIEADILQEVFLPIYNQEACDAALKLKVTERMFCAGYPEGGKDSCQGDSGGPAVMNETLVGIVSWGQGCAQPGKPGVYTRIAAVRDWLDMNIRLNAL